eukprot:6121782-Lingulodinium_polyedra.AAC.1
MDRGSEAFERGARNALGHDTVLGRGEDHGRSCIGPEARHGWQRSDAARPLTRNNHALVLDSHGPDGPSNVDAEVPDSFADGRWLRQAGCGLRKAPAHSAGAANED